MKQKNRKQTALILGILTAASAYCVMPAATASAAVLLNAEFETTNDSFTGRGAANVQWTSDQAYTGECSLYVSGRTASWNGASRSADGLLKAGETYAISAAVYQIGEDAAEMKFSLQYTDASGTTAYDQIALDTAENGVWTLLSNNAYTVPAGATDMFIYVETTESLTDFYLDSVSVNGTPSVIKKGDVNGDLKVDLADAVLLSRFLCAEPVTIEVGADYDDNGSVTAVDLTLLKQFLLNPPQSNVTGDWDNYEETVSSAMLRVYQDSLYRVGNTTRIREKIAAAQRGENVTIGYIGGSITGGGSSTSEAKRFVNLSAQYFADTFGTGNNVRFVNKGLAGTSSVVGNMRVDNDIFSQNCDIIFIEFAVNDQGDDRFRKSYESLVKKCLMQENAPAVVLITLCQQSGSSCQDWMAQVGEHYDLPVISGKDAIMNAISSGTLSWSDYGSGDTIHPGDGGHQLIADFIGYYYRQALRSENASDDYTLPTSAVFGDEYATAKLVTDLSSLTDFNAGSWTKGTNQAAYSGGYTFSKNGNTPMTFTVNGKGILLLFQSNDSSSMGTALVTVNGTTNPVSSNLRWTWGGLDGNVGYYQPQSGSLQVSISMQDQSTSFVLYGVAIIE